MATTVTSKGQVTIPKAVREKLGIEPGNAVDFRVEPDGKVVLLKVVGEAAENPFEKWRGIAGPGPSTDEIMEMSRGDDRVTTNILPDLSTADAQRSAWACAS